MPISVCTLCDGIITNKNDSWEHIIPASIGGRKKVKGFICKACNGKAGENWDAEFAKQLNFLGVFIGINREKNKKLPSQILVTSSGKKYLKRPDGTTTIAKPIIEEILGTRDKHFCSSSNDERSKTTSSPCKVEISQY